MTRWMVTWDEDDGVAYQSGPYESRRNAERQFHHRHTDPLAHNIEMWELRRLSCGACGGNGRGSIDHTCGVCEGNGSGPENVEEPTVTDRAVRGGA